MKKALTLLLLGLLILTVISSCKKKTDDVTPPVIPPTGSISGSIVVPAGTTADVNTFKVLSVLAESTVATNNYTVATYSGEFSTQMVSNSSDEVVMMGYDYPGQTDHTINARSTALAMMMNMPAALFLDTAAKKQFIHNILASPQLNNLVTSIESSIQANHNLFDTANTNIGAAMEALYASASFKTEQTQLAIPITINRSGRNFIFTNKIVAHSSVIGIYKNGARVQKIVIDGLQIFPTSLTEIISGNYGGVSADPVEHPYTLSGDGDFDIKIRTGRPGAGDGSAEHSEAFYENLRLFSYNIFTAYYPEVQTSSCKAAVFNNISNTINNITNATANNPLTTGGVASVLFTAIESTISSAANILQGCQPPAATTGFLGKISGYFKYVSKVLAPVGTIANIANNTMFAAQWGLSTAAFDTCFNAQGNMVGACSPVVYDRNGNAYHTVQIGTQTWFKENLRTTVYRDSAVIGDMNNIGTWANNTTSQSFLPAWCNYAFNSTNDATYGKLYNWYALNDPRGLCPTGWHVPDSTDLRTLTNYLGGDTIAGGPLKSTSSLWNTPNVGATNSTNFSALPGGWVNGVGDYYDLGKEAYFWSSTPYMDTFPVANHIYLYHNSKGASHLMHDKINGYSIRCIKD